MKFLRIVLATIFLVACNPSSPQPPAPTTSTTTTTTSTTTTTTSVPTTTTTTTVPVPVPPFDRSQWVWTGEPLPRSAADQPAGNFRFICEFSHLAVADPIMFPGRPGSGHLHMFFGNTSTNASSTYESLRAAPSSTCAGGPLNKSAYWMPAVINPAGKVVVPEFFSIYYKGNVGGGAGAIDIIRSIKPMPEGLRMIAGFDMLSMVPEMERHFDWYCEINQIKSNKIPDCASNELVGVVLHFPSCWNGRDLDSVDHRSHVAYPEWQGGVQKCPASYPVTLPEFTLGAWFQHDGHSSQWHLSSDRMPGWTMANGSSFHSDWFGGWDRDTINLWVSKCINGLLDCQDGQLGNGERLRKVPDYVGPREISQP